MTAFLHVDFICLQTSSREAERIRQYRSLFANINRRKQLPVAEQNTNNEWTELYWLWVFPDFSKENVE
jgi:hypothetical protein